jgi:pyruvate-formate lyase-activating enzyme
MCNDECPVCHTKDIQPYQSEEIKSDLTMGELIRHVAPDWVPDGGWPEQP